ncbi:aminoglycoside phosphotransferase family protein [Actinocrispum wychmicini]|uniref:Aminoglycoside phosphotransferase (APT) family kinase protein n=1 Tax=Actinocrispum wychmicini TaxID=1213861 RepID=A0A4R2IXB2_9PSEU|nr:aminoglycoside phosphotransferase family protein [Actinocrispum wychmicini]TCO48928.1 aminoglycoside phosphotransferase (APT) family kinase protein [Actinocrispum wychmicini]
MEGNGGNRLSWTEVPAAVRAAIEAALREPGPAVADGDQSTVVHAGIETGLSASGSAAGSTVVHAASQPGGFSPGMAARLLLADGRRVFVKAVGLERNPDSPAMHRREAVIAAQLPEGAPAPKLLWSYDDGDWVALVFEDVEGRNPTVPWRPDEWQRVHDAMVELSEVLTPSPIDTVDAGFAGWRSLAADDELAARLDPWSRANLGRLVELEEAWPQAAAGETLLHRDIRADNVLLTEDRVVFVDWPHAAVGAPWIDLLFMLPSVAMQGGPAPAEVWGTSPLAAEADPDAVTAVAAGLAGFMVHSALLPPPPNLPTIREFQRIQGEYAMAWLRSRLG